jgi:hypothetical protein
MVLPGTRPDVLVQEMLESTRITPVEALGAVLLAIDGVARPKN